MSTLKELRNKISVIQSTRKVTAAMKLVAGVKLRKAEQKNQSSKEYAAELNCVLGKLSDALVDVECEIFHGRKNVNTVLLIVFASDRGLCGNFNYMISKETKNTVAKLTASGKKVRIMCVGSKLVDAFRGMFGGGADNGCVVETVADFYRNTDMYKQSIELANLIISYFKREIVDQVVIIYTKYYSAMSRHVEHRSLIPVMREPNDDLTTTIFEPSPEKVLEALLPHNLTVQIYQAALESITSEQSSRMTSMDSATRNADSLLSEFQMKYNRMRQAKITQELMEVISGADAIAKG